LRQRKDSGGRVRDPLAVTSNSLLDALVSDVLAARPDAARVFVDRGMGCVGCAFAPFETIAEVARVYGIEAQALADALREAGVTFDVSKGAIQ
jgi:hybrid cluster-associated redox disulfide protein